MKPPGERDFSSKIVGQLAVMNSATKGEPIARGEIWLECSGKAGCENPRKAFFSDHKPTGSWEEENRRKLTKTLRRRRLRRFPPQREACERRSGEILIKVSASEP
jgi:hypothetical protein